MILSPKAAGIFDLPVETRWVTGPFGKRYQDYRFKPRTFPLTFTAYHCDKYTWAEVATRLGWAFDYDTETRLRFTGPDGVRDLFVRKENQSTAFSSLPFVAREPFVLGQTSEQFTLTAELPFYVGKPVRQELHVVHRPQSGTSPSLTKSNSFHALVTPGTTWSSWRTGLPT